MVKSTRLGTFLRNFWLDFAFSDSSQLKHAQIFYVLHHIPLEVRSSIVCSASIYKEQGYVKRVQASRSLVWMSSQCLNMQSRFPLPHFSLLSQLIGGALLSFHIPYLRVKCYRVSPGVYHRWRIKNQEIIILLHVVILSRKYKKVFLPQVFTLRIKRTWSAIMVWITWQWPMLYLTWKFRLTTPWNRSP